MNTAQKIILILGLAGIVLASAYPPWGALCTAPAQMSFGQVGQVLTPAYVTKRVEYRFLFEPPSAFGRYSPAFVVMGCEVGIEIPALLTAYVMIVAVTFGIVLLLGLRRRPKKAKNKKKQRTPRDRL